MDSDVFREVEARFHSSLPPEERSTFVTYKSPSEMMESIVAFEKDVKERRWFLRGLQKIRKFNGVVEPYFEVIDVMIQSNPAISALIWGALRLALRLASNYATFFEKLAGSLERISERLPAYQEMFYLAQKHDITPSPRLRSSLCDVYLDLLHFFQAVIRVFTKKDGNPKAAAILIGDLLWKPFDVRFHEFLERLDHHCSIFKDEFSLLQSYAGAHARKEEIAERVRSEKEREEAATSRVVLREMYNTTSETQRLLIDEQKDRILRRAQKWLAAPEYAQEYENVRNIREKDTAYWIFEEPVFRSWIQRSEKSSTSERILWVQGNPGSGKSVLAATAVDTLTQEVNEGCDKASICYFFFRDDLPSLNTSVHAYRALLAQLLYQSRENQAVIDAFAFAMKDNSTGQLVATNDELEDLLRVTMGNVGKCVIILDGVDECKDSSSLLYSLETWLRSCDFKLAMFSRPVLPFVPPDLKILEIGRLNQTDIQIFLQRKLQALKGARQIPGIIDENTLLSRLVVGADGMFLWARLMMCYLQSPALSSSQRVRTIMHVTFPEGLEVMYERLISLINAKHRVERNLATRILSLIAFALRPLTSKELQEALKISGDRYPEMDDDYSDFHQTIILSCSGLVEREAIVDSRYSSPVSSYRLIHSSAREYFRTCDIPRDPPAKARSKKDQQMHIGPIDSNLRIASLCLRYLTYHIPAQPLGGQIGTNAKSSSLDHSFPFYYYAAQYWTKHFQVLYNIYSSLRSTDTPIAEHEWHRQALVSLTRFLSQKFVLMSWIEAACTFGQFPSFKDVDNWLGTIRGHNELLSGVDYAQLSEDAQEFHLYLKDLQEVWAPTLLSSPSLMWQEVTAFTPCRLLAKTSSTAVNKLTAKKPVGKNLFHQPLCKISELSSDGLWVIILSVWPSRRFSNILLEASPSVASLYEACSGWAARFEIWPTEMASQPVVDLQVPLDSDEIWLQNQQSLWRSSSFPLWKLHFPLSIHPSGQLFVVLRTAYYLSISMEQQCPEKVQLKSRLIPLDFNKAEWTSNCRTYTTSDLISDSRNLELYIYWISFSSNGHYLCFAESYCQRPLKITIFELEEVDRLDMTLIRSARTSTAVQASSPETFRVIFHATRPTLAFLKDNRAYLWEFETAAAAVNECFARFPKIDKVAFSDCGEYLVIDDSFGDSPVLRRLAGNSRVLTNNNDIVSTNTTAVNNCTIHANASLAPLSEPGSGNMLLREGSLRRNASGRTLCVSNLKGNAVICSETTATGRTRIMELTKLPGWTHIETTNIAVRLPRSKNDMIQIIINKAEMAWYSTLDPVDNNLPAIVYRDPRAISEHAVAGIKRKQELENVPRKLKRI